MCICEDLVHLSRPKRSSPARWVHNTAQWPLYAIVRHCTPLYGNMAAPASRLYHVLLLTGLCFKCVACGVPAGKSDPFVELFTTKDKVKIGSKCTDLCVETFQYSSGFLCARRQVGSIRGAVHHQGRHAHHTRDQQQPSARVERGACMLT